MFFKDPLTLGNEPDNINLCTHLIALSGLSGLRLHNARAAFRNSNNPDNDNTNIGLRPCWPSPPNTLHPQNHR